MGVFRSEEVYHLKLRMPGDIESSVRIMDAFGKIEQDAIEFIPEKIPFKEISGILI